MAYRWDKAVLRWRDATGRFVAGGLPPFVLTPPSAAQIGADVEAVMQEVIAQYPDAEREDVRRMVAEDQMNLRRQMRRALFTPVEVD